MSTDLCERCLCLSTARCCLVLARALLRDCVQSQHSSFPSTCNLLKYILILMCQYRYYSNVKQSLTNALQEIYIYATILFCITHLNCSVDNVSQTRDIHWLIIELYIKWGNTLSINLEIERELSLTSCLF